jgi:pimeloyl-ACP methyl ester carboxylesterase
MQPALKEEGEFRYIDVGEGPVLIFLHGLFGALSNFEGPIAHFSGRYRVVMPMLPLYTLPMLNTNIPALAEFLDRFIRHKGFTEINLLGNSLGGHIALVYCTKHATNVRTLILTGSSGLYENAFGGGFPRREDKEYLRAKIALTFYDPKHTSDALVEECYVPGEERDPPQHGRRPAQPEDARVPDLGQAGHHHPARRGRGVPHPHPPQRALLDRRVRARRHDGAARSLQRHRGRLAFENLDTEVVSGE